MRSLITENLTKRRQFTIFFKEEIPKMWKQVVCEVILWLSKEIKFTQNKNNKLMQYVAKNLMNSEIVNIQGDL
jgi:hypothetical protein